MIDDLILRVQDSAIPPIAFPLLPGDTIIGRNRGCDLVIKHLSVSRRHAEIRMERQRIVLCDLRSKNGTYVNDCPAMVAEISPGDRLCFGSVHAQLVRRALDDGDSESDLPTPVFASDSHTIEVSPTHLSRAQTRVLERLLAGLSEKQIATALHSSVHTVHNHVQRIHRVYGVTSGRELLARFVRMNNGNGSQLGNGKGEEHARVPSQEFFNR